MQESWRQVDVELQRELTVSEDRIAAGRRFYNANVRAMNPRVESCPSTIVARRSARRTVDFSCPVRVRGPERVVRDGTEYVVHPGQPGGQGLAA